MFAILSGFTVCGIVWDCGDWAVISLAHTSARALAPYLPLKTGTAVALLRALLDTGAVSSDRLVVTSSAPLQHLPYDLGLELEAPKTPEAEPHLPPALAARLGFAKQKVEEIVSVARLAASPAAAAAAAGHGAVVQLQRLQQGKGVEDHTADIPAEWFSRPKPYDVRREQQLQLPAFPTTTIGSFPQTAGARVFPCFLAPSAHIAPY